MRVQSFTDMQKLQDIALYFSKCEVNRNILIFINQTKIISLGTHSVSSIGQKLERKIYVKVIFTIYQLFPSKLVFIITIAHIMICSK